MRWFLRYFYYFLLGGFGYGAMEIIWRGKTHYSMFFAGGIILAIFCYINDNSDLIFPWKCFIGAVIITLIEFIFGIVFNIILKENVWDYSGLPLNILGQICLPFSIAWFGISFIVFWLMKKLRTNQND